MNVDAMDVDCEKEKVRQSAAAATKLIVEGANMTLNNMDKCSR